MSTTKPNNVSSPILTINQIRNGTLRALNEEIDKLYKPRYEVRSKYGKYKVLKFEGNRSEVLVRGVSKEVAEGYIKLLKEE